MVSFTVRKIKSESNNLGELLNKKRQEAGLSLNQLSRRTSIAERYLVAIESEEWLKLPGEVYAKIFLRRYAFEVGLDPIRVEKKYEQNKVSFASSSIHSLQKTLPLSSSHFIILPKFIRNFLIVFLLILLVSYIGWQAKAYFTPPQLSIYYPTDNLIIDTPTIILSGETDPEVTIMINDVLVPVNKGLFEEELDLQPGVNILKVTATKKNGPAKEIFVRVMLRT
jgi:transcriptional regulator with XRE-family HTH domain